ncbi:MAG: M24 family metallopeptidase [Halanaerobiales bacterium]
MNNRLKKVLERLEDYELDSFIIYNSLNIRYLSGFTGSSGYLYISKSKSVLLTDFRYIEQASNECEDFQVVDMLKDGFIRTISSIIEQDDVKIIGFEKQTVTYDEFETLKKGIKGKELIGISNFVETIRMIKDEEELKDIKKAVNIGDLAFKHLLGYIKPGITELDIALELEFFMKKQGADKLSFDSIVASGVHSSMPHAKPTNKKIEIGDLLTLDFGCVYNGYCSDMTRTIAIGKVDDKQKSIYDTVLEAQLKALDYIKSGVSGKDADEVSRNIIRNAGYGKYFGHGLGHAVGLNIHESPRLSPKEEKRLSKNMVVTVEPGIYIPGIGGVRIEDLVVVKDNGIKNYTKSSKELIIV